MNIAEVMSKTMDVGFVFTDKAGKETSINLKVYEESLTPDTLSLVMGFEKDQDLFKLCDALAMMIESWDLTFQKPGAPAEDFQPTAENLRRTPLSFLLACVQAIAETWSGNGQRPNPSASTSADSANSEILTIN